MQPEAPIPCRRPALTKARIFSLQVMAARVATLAEARPGSLFGLPKEEAREIRRAKLLIDELARWKQRKDATR